MSSAKKCIDSGTIDQIVKASKGKLNGDQAMQLLYDLEKKVQESKKIDSTYKLEDFLSDQAKEIYRIKQTAVTKSKAKLLNTLIKKDLSDFIENFDQPADKAVEALLVGRYTLNDKSRLSVAAKINATRKELMGGFINDLNSIDNRNNGIKGETLKSVRQGIHSKDIMYELYNMRQEGTDPNISLTKNVQAHEIAKVIVKYQDVVRERLNRAGADIQMLEGRIGRQTHDISKIRKTGLSKWIQDVIPLLDMKKTFGEKIYKVDIRTQLSSIYDNITAGKGLAFEKLMNSEDLTSGSSLAGQLTNNARELHFKGPDHWLQYNEKYGQGSMEKIIVKDLMSGARDITLMETLGTDPEKMLFGKDGILQTYSTKNDKAGNFETADKLKENLIRNWYDALTGKTDIPDSINVAKISNTVLALNYLSKLGGATLSAVTDIPNQVAQLAYNGINPIEGYMKTFNNLTFGLSPKFKQDIAASIGAGLEGTIGDFVSRMNLAGDEPPGILSNMLRLFFKLNLLQPWTDAHKSGMSLTLSNLLGRSADTPFEALDSELVRSLVQYGINAKEWKLIRSTVTIAEDGNSYLIPANVNNVDNQLILDYAGKQDLGTDSINRIKDELRTKLQTYISDQVDEGVITPGVKEKVVTTWGLQKGSIPGEIVRHLMQFWQFPVKFLNNMGMNPLDIGHGRDISGKGYDFTKGISEVNRFMFSPDAMGYAAFIAQVLFFGYVSMSLKDISKNQTPSTDFSNPKVTTRALLASGALGLYGDFLFDEYSKYGENFVGTIIGPTSQSITNIVDIIKNAGIKGIVQGDKKGFKNAGKSAYNLIKNNTPGINLFYTKMALDYMILYHLEEYFNPDYQSKRESRMRETGQEYIIQP